MIGTQALLVYFSAGLGGILAAPGMGPADFVIKHTERCKGFESDSTMRIYTRRGKPNLSLNVSFPFKFSDKIGFDLTVDVKKNGGWKPNFFHAKGQGMCTGTKLGQPDFFVLLAKSLNAPEPYTCPLPSGRIVILDYVPDMQAFQSGIAGDMMPYGEFRIHSNITHKNEVFDCQMFFVDIVPKKTKKRGR